MNAGIEPLKRSTADLFPKLDGMLLGLLRSLVPAIGRSKRFAQMESQGCGRASSGYGASRSFHRRDGYVAENPAINSSADLAAFINRLNRKASAFTAG